MNRYIREFEGQLVEVLYDEENQKCLFRLEDVALAAGFSKVASLRYHTKTKIREVEIDGNLYLKARALNKIAKAANKTPGMKRFASWAVGLAGKINIREIQGRPVPAVVNGVPCALIEKPVTTDFVKAAIGNTKKPEASAWPFPLKKTLYTISEAAGQLGMQAKELNDWLVDQGYALRYESNNSIRFLNWFKEQKFCAYPVINDEKGSRISRVPKLTDKGIEYVKNRIESERSNNVLAFARKEASQEEKAEKEVDDLIESTFADLVLNYKYDSLLGYGKREYKITKDQLIPRVKGIIAAVKLKEKSNE